MGPVTEMRTVSGFHLIFFVNVWHLCQISLFSSYSFNTGARNSYHSVKILYQNLSLLTFNDSKPLPLLWEERWVHSSSVQDGCAMLGRQHVCVSSWHYLEIKCSLRRWMCRVDTGGCLGSRDCPDGMSIWSVDSKDLSSKCALALYIHQDLNWMKGQEGRIESFCLVWVTVFFWPWLDFLAFIINELAPFNKFLPYLCYLCFLFLWRIHTSVANIQMHLCK